MLLPLALIVVFSPANVLTLTQALKTAAAHQPQLRQARAVAEAAHARAGEVRAPLLPQVGGTATYQRTTSNFIARPGAVPSNLLPQAPNGNTFNFWNFGLTASQLVYDSQQSIDAFRAANELARAQGDTERAVRLQVELAVRTNFYVARATRALVEVARETLTNQERHLAQIQGFVTVGTRPEIDLAQARTDRANAQLQLINAENAYAVAKTQLNQTMGVVGPTDYDVAEEPPFAVDGEDAPLDTLWAESLRDRPDLMSLERQLRAQTLTVHSVEGGWGPSLSAATNFTAAGVDITKLGWNWNASVTLTFPFFSGLLTWETRREARANLDSLGAQRETLVLQARTDLESAQLAVRAAKVGQLAAHEAAVNGRERLRLAEGRYRAGAGSVIELGDAQVAATNTAAAEVQAEYNLATARAQLTKALGRH